MDAPDNPIESIEIAMTTANQLADIVLKIGEVTIVLAQKRVTLEEKMLRRYLHDLAKTSANTAAMLHQLTRDGAKGNSESFSEIAQITSETHAAIEELLKIVRYNLNFLEQYFEHDFYARLINEFKFEERLLNASAKLPVDK
jgi:GTPase Era involved in 16S rRNA processing